VSRFRRIGRTTGSRGERKELGGLFRWFHIPRVLPGTIVEASFAGS
jgi:hypothetical protein